MGSLPTATTVLIIPDKNQYNYGVAKLRDTDMIAVDQGGLNRLCSTRYSIAYMAFMGLFVSFVLKINLSTAIVAMTNNTQADRHIIDPCFPPIPVPYITTMMPLTTPDDVRTSPHSDNGTSTPQGADNVTLVDPVTTVPTPLSTTGGLFRVLTVNAVKASTFDWDSKLRGFILASFFFGYILTQLPAGILAAMFGPKRIVGGGIFIASVMTLLTPIAAESSPYLLIACRIGVGLGLGVVYPAFHEMWARWAPPMERTLMISIASAGAYVGAVVTPPLVGFICSAGVTGGWSTSFYVTGGMGLMWCVLWALLVFDSPAQHPRISIEEKLYLLTRVKQHHHDVEQMTVPWKQIVTSPQLWAIAVAHFSTMWGMNLILICLPTYFTDILRFDTKTTGLYAAIPYIAYTVIMLMTSVVADNLRRAKLLTTTLVRKIFQTLGNGLPAILLFTLHFSGCSITTPVILLTAAVGCLGFTMAGYHPNHVDIAPKYAGIMMGLTNMLANTTGFIAPMLVGALTSGNDLRHQWDTIFYICAAVYLVGMIVYAVGGSGEKIWWAEGVTAKKLRMEQERLERANDFGQSLHASLIISLSFSPPGL